MSFPWAKQYEPKPSASCSGWTRSCRCRASSTTRSAPAIRCRATSTISGTSAFSPAVCLMIQIVTGIVLAMHYAANAAVAFDSVEHIMRDVNWGWMLRYAHANGAELLLHRDLHPHLPRLLLRLATRPRAR